MAEATTFKDLVHEAFIAPLRSVLIVDDQYPTWEEIFSFYIADNESSSLINQHCLKKSWKDPNISNEVMKLIKEFRNKKPGFIIDIHDGISTNFAEKSAGSETPKELADHLHQSDLLVLDYNLEGAEGGTGGDIARKILASVLRNQHFNLVVVHTSENLDNVIYECLRSLMKSCTSQYDNACSDEVSEIELLIEDKEDAQEFDRSLITEHIDMATYFKVRHPEGGLQKALGDFMQGIGSFSALCTWAECLNLETKKKKYFFYWAIKEFESRYTADFTESPPQMLSWNISESCKWLHTPRGFVCFVSKGPDNLLAELENALIDWKPTPSRLLSAKYRDEISRFGADVEDTSLQQKHAFAKFYETIRKPGMEGLPLEQIKMLRSYKLKDHVSRLSEMLSFLVEDKIANFGQKIYSADELSGFTFQEHYKVNLNSSADRKKAVNQYNRYICCLPTKEKLIEDSSEQLDSGHIFILDGTWWVCATPACDLQPGQNTIAFKKGTNTTLRPFTAIKLHPSNPNSLSDLHINSGSYCYVEHNGEILGLGIKSPKDDSNNPAIQKVDWCAFVAENGGVIKRGKLSLLELQLELDDPKIRSDRKEAEVVAKLRYEYALNYIQRVGTSVSRIGLGYISP
ncbi:hypothetical protein JK232_21290 [Nissabacter archeti]|uniref:Response receiver domain-containing protein n=1 Tax=Nissabacter archeti TaxID=1917880 RepID=A0ABS5JN81_9GAMM|nr:response regulator receiver domain [Nissabacter archeti]MBS0971421.1 hypothetical protein [Nissabacter archeti]